MSDTFDSGEILTQDELDFSDAGIEAREVVFTITNVSRKELQHGVMAQIELTPLEPGIVNFPITETIWLSYDDPENPKSAITREIGASQMKRLLIAVYGVPNGSFEGLRDRYVTGWLKEDKNTGRPTVGSFKATTEAVLEAAVEAAGLAGV